MAMQSCSTHLHFSVCSLRLLFWSEANCCQQGADLETLKQSSRLVHYCATPLLFDPLFRKQIQEEQFVQPPVKVWIIYIILVLYTLCPRYPRYPSQISIFAAWFQERVWTSWPVLHAAAEPSPLRFFSLKVKSCPAEAPPLQRLQHVGERPQLQHRLGRHAAQQIEGRALDAGNLQQLPPAVRSVSAEHGLHSGPSPATVSSPQVCILHEYWRHPCQIVPQDLTL